MSLCWCFDDMLCLSLNVLLTVHTYLIMPFMFNFCLRIIKCILQKTLHDLHVLQDCCCFSRFFPWKGFSLSHSAPELLSKHDVPRGWSDQASDPRLKCFRWDVWSNLRLVIASPMWLLIIQQPANCWHLHRILKKIFTKLLHDLGRLSYSMILDPFLCALFVLTVKLLWKSAKPFIFSEVPHQVALDQDIVQWPGQGKQTWYQSASCCKVTAIRRPFDHWKRLNLESRSSELN